jgi:hypothetical protein
MRHKNLQAAHQRHGHAEQIDPGSSGYASMPVDEQPARSRNEPCRVWVSNFSHRRLSRLFAHLVSANPLRRKPRSGSVFVRGIIFVARPSRRDSWHRFSWHRFSWHPPSFGRPSSHLLSWRPLSYGPVSAFPTSSCPRRTRCRRTSRPRQQRPKQPAQNTARGLGTTQLTAEAGPRVQNLVNEIRPLGSNRQLTSGTNFRATPFMQ